MGKEKIFIYVKLINRYMDNLDVLDYTRSLNLYGNSQNVIAIGIRYEPLHIAEIRLGCAFRAMSVALYSFCRSTATILCF